MAAPKDLQAISLLRSNGFRRAVINLVLELCREARERHQEQWSKLKRENPEMFVQPLDLTRVMSSAVRFDRTRLEQVFNDAYFDHVSYPAPVRLEDFFASACEHFSVPEEAELNSAFERFARSVESRIVEDGHSARWSEPLHVLSGYQSDLLLAEQEEVFVSTEQSTRVWLSTVTASRGMSDRNIARDPHAILADLVGGVSWLVQVSGFHSRLSMDHLSLELRRVMGSLLRTLVLTSALAIDMESENDCDEDLDILRRSALSFLRWGLSAYFAKATKKDSFEGRRVRNAVRLLAHADEAEDDSVKLSLSFCGIESLLCTKTDGIAEELSRNAATLLVGDAKERRAFIESTKKLYNVRSRVLHGATTEVEAENAVSARRTAAHALWNVWRWCDWKHRLDGEPDAPEEFFEALKDAEISGRAMVGPGYTQ